MNTQDNTVIEQLYAYIHTTQLYKTLGLDKNVHIRFLAQGEYNQNFMLEDAQKQYVLRINHGSQITVDNQIEYEFKALQALELSGVTPKGYFVDGSFQYFDQGILIMEFLRGRSLDYTSDLVIAADIFRNIHGVTLNADMYTHFIREQNIFTARIVESCKLLEHVWDSNALAVETKHFITRIVDYAHKHEHEQAYFEDQPLFCINNTEVNSGNFVIDDTVQYAGNLSKGYLIDWEKPVISDPCQDITHFLAPTTTMWKTDTILSPDQIEMFYQHYDRDGALNIRERVQQYNPYLYMRAISWCAYAQVEYQKEYQVQQHTRKQLNNRDTYSKIQQYLSTDFLQNVFSEIL